MSKPKSQEFILWFDEVKMRDLPHVGGKNASLGEMYQVLVSKGINIPFGFCVTAYAFKYFLDRAGIANKIKDLLAKLDPTKIEDLKKTGAKIRGMVVKSTLPKELEKEIKKAYQKLSRKYCLSNLDVAVRSSATAEDLPVASYAGQLETYLNVKGDKALLETIKKCFASLYTNRAISYSADHGFNHAQIYVSVGVQKMIRSDKACAGVAFTLDTQTGFPDVVLINGSWGLGENVVKGRINPDQYVVFKPTLKRGFRPIIGKTLGTKKRKLIYCKNGNKTTCNVPVLQKDRRKYVLSDDEILTLARWCSLIEDHYKKPQDVEWAKDGLDGKLYIVQSRPETVHAGKEVKVLKEYILEKIESSKLKALNSNSEFGKVLVTGTAIGFKIGQGRANLIKSIKEIHKFKEGEVLVTRETDPDWEPIMRKARAIVTDTGGRTCHAAIVSRELGVPCIVGTRIGTKVIKSGQQITVSCAEGEKGKVYSGLIPFRVLETNLTEISRPKTKIMMNVGEPDRAFAFSFIPNDGVGLAREEFIISNYIRIHPKALIEYRKLKDKKVKRQIDQLTYGYENKTQFFVDKLAEGIATIASAFYPKEVIVRTSDFKTNEYASLIGGEIYEPEEANPMLGWRGASRYYDPKFKEAFGLECRAIKKVREEMGLDNVIVMIPFCRTIEEGKKVLKVMEQYGLKKHRKVEIKNQNYKSKFKKSLKPLQIYVMAEIPSNIELASEFAQIFDGFSIGSNDLTQLTLGVDRDSEFVAHIFNENNPAILESIRRLIKQAHQTRRKVGICGQAPSDFPNFARFLVECGIDSISLNPDTVIKTTLDILKVEKKLKKRKKLRFV